MTLIARYIGKDEVLYAYDKKAKHPYFSIWDKSQCIVQYNGDDYDEAKEIISDEIDISVKRNYTNTLTLKLHPEKEKAYTTKSPTYANFAFICQNTLPAIMPTADNIGASAYYANEIQNLRAEINALKMKETEPDDEEEDDEDDEQPEGMALINGVNTLLEHPLIAGLITKWTSGSQPVRNLAGVNNTLEECLETLFNKGVTVQHLQKLAEMPEAKIKMLLSML